MSYYILEGKKPKRINDCDTWERWKQTADRQVALTTVGSVMLSTVFLGYPAICQGYLDGVVKLFETMLFVEGNVLRSWHWTSWSEAEAGHRVIAQMLMLTPEAKGGIWADD